MECSANCLVAFLHSQPCYLVNVDTVCQKKKIGNQKSNKSQTVGKQITPCEKIGFPIKNQQNHIPELCNSCGSLPSVSNSTTCHLENRPVAETIHAFRFSSFLFCTKEHGIVTTGHMHWQGLHMTCVVVYWLGWHVWFRRGHHHTTHHWYARVTLIQHTTCSQLAW